MRSGYSVFGKEYEIMLKNDLHAPLSVDIKLIEKMIFLDENSYESLYSVKPITFSMKDHELFNFSQKFKSDKDYETIKNILNFTSKMAKKFNVPIKEMKFGGTEKEIIKRGTDWCADMARVMAVILDCLDITARIIYLANPKKLYNSHVVVEAFYENKFGIVDPIYGYCLYDEKPLSAMDIYRNNKYLKDYPEFYRNLYSMIAISEYNPLDKENNYIITKINEFYMRIFNNKN